MVRCHPSVRRPRATRARILARDDAPLHSGSSEERRSADGPPAKGLGSARRLRQRRGAAGADPPIRRPSGTNRTRSTSPESTRFRTSWPAVRSQGRTVWSAPAVARRCPSVLKATSVPGAWEGRGQSTPTGSSKHLRPIAGAVPPSIPIRMDRAVHLGQFLPDFPKLGICAIQERELVGYGHAAPPRLPLSYDEIVVPL
jgi:hypothetical protein